jgi:hypothetical protein
MTTISATPSIEYAAATRVPLRSLVRVNLNAAVLAAAATESLTAAVRGAGVHLAVGNPGGTAADLLPVNFGACAISIAMCMVVGVAIAALINRRSSRPVRTYRIVTGVLVLVSFVPPLIAGATSASTKLTLIAAHLIAAAIIVPLVSRSLASSR